MKRIFSLIAVLSVLVVGSASTVFAQSGTIAVNAAYWKSNDKFDVVVRETPGAKLKVYVNDKNPILATTNKKGWVTFRKVGLSGTGKLSFAQVMGSGKSTHQHAINYSRVFTVTAHTVAFAAPVVKQAAAAVAPTPQPAPAAPVAATPPATNTGTSDSNLSNTNTYVNTNGTTVHSPAASTDGSVPAGATAQCNDGTYSFSQHHSGTCSGHGGVASWL